VPLLGNVRLMLLFAELNPLICAGSGELGLQLL